MHLPTGWPRWRRCILRTMISPVCQPVSMLSHWTDWLFDVGSAFPLQEYYAPCYANGSLTLLFLPISRHSQNILRSPSNAASIAVASSPARASRARISLIGNVTILPDDIDVETTDELKSCYLAKHPDAKWWLPGDEDGAHIVSICLLPLTY
jgi:hypothetical protein